MDEDSDDRPPMVRGMEWASRVTAISLEMVLPALGGVWIDRKLGTVPLFLILGVVLGLAVGLMQLVRLGTETQRRERDGRSGSQESDNDFPSDDVPRGPRL